jgi:head-tail adaptor
MVYDFTAADLTSMREAQYGHMMDAGYFQALTRTYDTYGEQIDSWADTGSLVDCGLDMRSGSEMQRDNKTVVQYDAVLRIQVTEIPSEMRRFRVTKRHGETLTTPLVFDIVAPVQRGPSGNRILLNKVST